MRRFAQVMIVALALMCAAPQAMAQAIAPEAFRDRAIAAIRAQAPNIDITVRDALGLTLRDREDEERGEWFVNLDNAYNSYVDDPTQLDALIARYTAFSIDMPKADTSPGFIVSVLRPRSFVDDYARMLAQSGETTAEQSALYWRPFAGDLIELLAFDSDTTIQYATTDTLADAGVSAEQAWALAPGNLPARLGEVSVEAFDDAPGLSAMTSPTMLAPSALADPGFCAREHIEGGIYMVVDRNTYLAADPSVPGAVAFFEGLTASLINDGESMSATLLSCQNGRVRAIAPGDAKPRTRT